MRMSETRPVLQPKPEHAIHPNVRQPNQRHPQRHRLLQRHPGRQQHQRRRLRVRAVVHCGAEGGVREVARHGEVGDKEPPGEDPPWLVGVFVEGPDGAAEDAEAFQAEEVARPGFHEAVCHGHFGRLVLVVEKRRVGSGFYGGGL